MLGNLTQTHLVIRTAQNTNDNSKNIKMNKAHKST
jgi:hypothetical protein